MVLLYLHKALTLWTTLLWVFIFVSWCVFAITPPSCSLVVGWWHRCVELFWCSTNNGAEIWDFKSPQLVLYSSAKQLFYIVLYILLFWKVRNLILEIWRYTNKDLKWIMQLFLFSSSGRLWLSTIVVKNVLAFSYCCALSEWLLRNVTSKWCCHSLRNWGCFFSSTINTSCSFPA